MNFFVISLREDNERTRYIDDIKQTLLPELKILDAVNGTKIRREFINFLYNKSVITPIITNQYSKGTIGCYLSHIKMWTKIRKERLKHTTILEDDFHINANFKNDIHDIIDELPTTYDICYLFYHPYCYKCYKNFDKFEITGKKLIRKSVPTWGLVGYILSYKGAVKLLKLCNKMTGPIDNMVAKHLLLGKLEGYHSRELLVDTIGECLYKDDKSIRFKSNASYGGFFI